MNAEELWKEFCSKTGTDEQTPYSAWAFGGAPDQLAALVIEGIKTGTASAYDWYLEDSKEPLPKVGDFSVILDSRDEALCVICTTATAVVPFDQVGEDHAKQEGEGDLSLNYWRNAHQEFFIREFAGTEHQFHEKLPVLTERFNLLYSLFRVEQMEDNDAMAICSWKYDGVYAEYDFPSWEECCERGWALTQAQKRWNSYFSVYYRGQLFGFFHIMDRTDHIELGVGMKPEFCGRHQGKMFMELALAKIKELHFGLPILLSVRTFNQRAITCYQQVGFKIQEKYIENSHHASGEMYRMILER